MNARKDFLLACHIVAAADASGVTVEAMKGPGTARHMSRPRQICMAAARARHGFSLPEIGAAFNRDHTTVLYACRKLGVI